MSLVAQAPLTATDGSTDPRYSFNFTAAAGFEARHNLVLGCRVCSAGAGHSCSEAETPVLVSQVSCQLLAMVLKGGNKKDTCLSSLSDLLANASFGSAS